MNTREFHPNRFVAPSQKVRSIQKRYVSYFQPEALVADLGCGEGVFLELLRESGRTGIGVDLTQEFVSAIKKRGMRAVRKDAFTFLRENRASFQGVFASHLIEHFSADDGMKLLQLMSDSLQPDGIMILMTPTYEDILVSSERFWLDVTHVRPYPLLLLEELYKHFELEIVDSGYDPSTRIHGSFVKPHVTVRNIIHRIRFGKYYNVGDTFIVGRKKVKA
jgi:SAM-dependent methyltransferase